MIWADRIGVVATFIVCLILLVFSKPGHFDPVFFVDVLVRTVVPLWVFMRLLDWALGLGARRRSRVTYHWQ